MFVAGVRHDPFVIAQKLHSAEQFAQFVMLEQEARVTRMAACGLVDEKSIEQQNAPTAKRPFKSWNKLTMEKGHVQDHIETLRAKRERLLEVRNHRRDWKAIAACEFRDRSHPGLRKIRGDDLDASPRQRKCVAACAGCDVERESMRHQGQHLEHRWLGVAGNGAAMALLPHCALRRAHTTRARVRTSTRRAPAASSVRAHSSTVAPVVITSSISSTRRLATRAGRFTANARRTLSRRSLWSAEVCGGVGRIRTRVVTSSGRSSRRATAEASSAAWLNPRHRRRPRWSGTGITMS